MRTRPARFGSPALLAALAAAPLLCAGCGDAGRPVWDGKGPLKVGVILPMTQQTATYGEESWNGMQLAAEDLRAREGTPAFELVLRDDRSNKQEAGNHAKALIETEQVHVLVGSVASSNTKQIFMEAREAGVPAITPASTNDRLTVEGGALTSRVCFKDSFQGRLQAEFALARGWKRAAVVVDKAQDYSLGLAEFFKQAYEAGGGQTSLHYYVTEDTDFSSVIENVATQAPDLIFVAGYYEQIGPMIRQAKGRWDGKPILGGDGLDSPELPKLVGDTQAEIYLSTHFAADAPFERMRDFAARYKSRFGKSPGAMAALGYDVLLVLMDAARRARDAGTPDQLAQAIAQTQGVEGVSDKIDLTTPDRTPIKDAVIVKVDGGLKFHQAVPAPR